MDIDAVRGTVTVNAEPTTFATVELRLAGRSVETRLVPPEGQVTFTVNTAARAAAGGPPYPNGAQQLQTLGTKRPPVPGCPAQIGGIVQPVTLANP